MSQVIVVGGGLAGHAAAHTVLEHGGRVLLLDKSPFCGGNSTKATSGINGAGTRAQRRLNIQDSAEAFEQDTLKSAGSGARPELVRALTYQSGPAVEWLKDAFNLDLGLVGQLGAHSYARTHRGGERFPGMMITYALMEKFEHACKTTPERAQLVNKAEVTKLLRNGDEIVGVEYVVKGKAHTAHGGVVLATGGFGADFSSTSLLQQVEAEWRQLPMWKDIPNLPPLRSFPTTNGPHCTGDGIKLATAVGAATCDMAFVQVHPTGLVDPREPDAKVKWLAAEALRGSGAILVDGHGRRFCNELGKRDYVSGKMLTNQGPYRLIMNSKQAGEFEWHCEHYVGRGVMVRLESGRALAQHLKVPLATISATFEEYNGSARANKDDFGKQFFRNTPYKVDDVFHVAEVTPVVHYTMGGLTTDADGQVLDGANKVIPGLFAAGEIIGGIHGNNRLGGSSLLDCVVFGRLAGSAAAKHLLATALSRPPTSTSTGNEEVHINWGDKTVTIRPLGAQPADGSVPQAGQGSVEQEGEAAEESKPKNVEELPEMTMAEVAKHNTKQDCWVVLHDLVYDVTAFLEDHPGGAASIVAYAGKDATASFDMLHSPDIIGKYAMDYVVGRLIPDGKSRQPAAASVPLTLEEVAKHTTKDDCWMAIHGDVYDVTTFLNDHPAGAKILLKYAGQDATAAFDAAGHPKDIVEQLGLEHLRLGPLEGAQAVASASTTTAVEERRDTQVDGVPPLSKILNLFDFEAVARKVMSQQGWAYYSSGSDDEITLRENHTAFQRLWLRPRVLVDVKSISLSSTMLGYKVNMPVYITSCALGRLAHPDGELCLTRGAGARGVIQLCPTLASCTLEEMTSATVPGQTQFLQLYVNQNRKISERLIRRAEKGGIKAIFVTVDAPQLGRREKDMRVKFTQETADEQQDDDKEGKVDRDQGAARAISQFIDPGLSWKDIDWLRSVTDLPLVLKGVQTAEDAVLAAERGLDGIVCSNHGGRQLDTARSGIEVLVEVMAALRERGLQDKLEVYVDGGIRRGSDVIKAIALGAKAVGIGRPTLYAMAGYGAKGVEHVFQILEDEMIMNMRLMGTPAIPDLKPSMVCVKSIASHGNPPRDSLAEYVYEPLTTMAKL